MKKHLYFRYSTLRKPDYSNKFCADSFLTNKSDTVKIILGESVFIHKVKITPIFLNEWAIIGGITFLAGLCITISIIAIKPWNLSIFRRKGKFFTWVKPKILDKEPQATSQIERPGRKTKLLVSKVKKLSM